MLSTLFLFLLFQTKIIGDQFNENYISNNLKYALLLNQKKKTLIYKILSLITLSPIKERNYLGRILIKWEIVPRVSF